MKLAIDGGPKAVAGPIPRFNTIGVAERLAAARVCRISPLSGFLGGELFGGFNVRRLEEVWADVFKVKHAIACNSATSGLLLACMAAGVTSNSIVRTTPYTMSATAAAPKFLGAYISFDDIEQETFSLVPWSSEGVDVTIVTNLFGHPAQLTKTRKLVDRDKGILIEDNAQAIFAKEGKKYAGTVGHIGVFSGNVHKAIQCGEGGICVTDDDDLAHKMRLALNHGELAGGPVGLNLRLTEIQAAIWLEQLYKADKIIADRQETARAFIKAANIPGIRPPITREGCTHVYYCVPLLVDENELGMSRKWFVEAMIAEGVPLREGYTNPLYNLPAFQGSPLPVTERVENSMICYENCWWAPTERQLEQFADAFAKVAGSVSQVRFARAQ